MQDPNNPNDEEFFDGEFDQEFDEFDSFGDLPDDNSPYDAQADDAMGDLPEDDAFMDAGWDDFDDQQDGTKSAKKGKSKFGGGGKGLSFNTIVIGVAVLVGLGVLVYQVVSTPAPGGGGSRFQSVLDFTGSTDGPVLGQPAPQEQTAPDGFDDVQSADGGFLNNPDLLDGPAPADPSDPSLDGGLPMPSPISNEIDDHGMEQETMAAEANDVLTPMPDFSFAESQGVPRGPDAMSGAQDTLAEPSSPALDIIRRAQTQQQQAQESEAASIDLPVPAQEESVPAPVETAVAPTPTPEPTSTPVPEPVATPAPVAAPVATADSDAQKEILARLESLSGRLGVMEQQIVQLRESGETDLEGLEREISALKNGMNAVADATGASSATPSAPKVAPTPKREATPAPRPAAKAPTPARSAAASASSWELRAAQPGRAWISRAGSREMQSVVPGDTIAGIGQVVRIDYAGGRWTVVGTQGQIRQ